MKSMIKFPPVVWLGISILVGAGLLNLTHLAKSHNTQDMSEGNINFIESKSTVEKKLGIQLMKKEKYEAAASQFEASLDKDRNDPEALIYLNNAKAGKDFVKIAVVVPISSNLNISQEILRGVAQAQDKINRQGGIQGKFLKVVIADDANQPERSQKIANQLVADEQILAVVGHNASNASLAAAPIYQKNELVMITATSFANNLSNFGSYIFRVVPSTKEMAKPLADYITSKSKNTKLAICYDSEAPDNVSFKDEFLASFLAKGGILVPLVCDLSSPKFDPPMMIDQAVNQGAKALLMTPHVDRLDQAILLAEANRHQLTLLSSPTLFTIKTLEQGKKEVEGLLLSVPWYPQKNNAFVADSSRYWGARVNWRTAMAYDATLAIAEGLKNHLTRYSLKYTLHSPDFVVSGATGTFRFLPSGDRLGSVYLTQIQKTSRGNDFVLIQSP